MTVLSVAAGALALIVIGAPVADASSKADEIIVKHVEARGGAERLAGLQTVRATGVMRQRGLATPFTLWTQRPNRARMEITLQGITLVQAYDGKNAWWINPLAGARTPQAMPKDLARSIERWVDFDGPLASYKDKGHTVAYAGEHKTDSGQRRHELTVTLADGVEWSVFIDAKTYLEVERSYEQTFGGKTRVARFEFGDFMTVDGVTVPGKIEGVGPDGVRYAMTFDAYDFDVAVDQAMFVMPAAPATEDETTGLVELAGVGPLKDRFNDDAGAVRAVMLLSPN
jgi:hypothetical protein